MKQNILEKSNQNNNEFQVKFQENFRSHASNNGNGDSE